MREKILHYIEKNSRISIADLAAVLGEDEIVIANELAAMEDEHIICGYHTMIDWDKTDIEQVTGLIEVRVSPQLGFGFDAIAQQIMEYDEVTALYLISGSYDFLLTIEGRTLREVAIFVNERLAVLDTVLSTKTNFILKRYKAHGTLMTGPEKDERIQMMS